MTQNTEQNVQTQDEQALRITNAIGGRYAPGDIYSWFREELATAEARGAEEQRRKDAEGYGRPVYQWHLTPDDNWVTAVDATELEQVRNGYPDSETRTLYTRPANVAVLEARVKVLEEALKKADKFITNGIEFGFIRMPDSDTPDSALDTPGIIRAALTREGGV
ncbi:hypothetical protein [Gluconobacter cerinus]|uniref:hypothetical protein n=1 Tax=Gluconobacter cerinus TaxID=38307 RepID=UPI001B8D0F2D|nr:hypothetical protein [Gluconobacter cerinus]MBS1067289.1 hypothetical protein [Gluconobacter cerinus]